MDKTLFPPNGKLTLDKVRNLRIRYSRGGYSLQELADAEGVTRTAMWLAMTGETWRKAGGPVPPLWERATLEDDCYVPLNYAAGLCGKSRSPLLVAAERGLIPTHRSPNNTRVWIDTSVVRDFLAKEELRKVPFDVWFWALVKQGEPNECWLWQGNRLPSGYGRFGRGKGVGHHSAHRTAFVLTHGPIPEGKWVLHHCDNPPCCNPSHLYVGTAKDNAQDRERRGRGGKGHRQFMFTYEEAQQIRAEWLPFRRGSYFGGQFAPRSLTGLARKYGCSQSTIAQIIRNPNYGKCEGR